MADYHVLELSVTFRSTAVIFYLIHGFVLVKGRYLAPHLSDLSNSDVCSEVAQR